MCFFRRLGVLSALAFSLVFSATASAQVDLRGQFPSGKSKRSQNWNKVEQVLTLNGMELPTKSEQRQYLRLEYGSKNDAGEFPIRVSTEGLNVKMELPGGLSLQYDSSLADAKVSNPALQPIADVLKSLNGVVMTFLIDEKAKVKKVTGPEAILAKATPAAQVALKEFLDEEKLKRQYQDELARLPDNKVKPGDKWQREEQMSLGGGQTMTFAREFTYDGTVDHKGKKSHKISVKTNSVVYAVENPQFKVSSSDLKVTKSSGTMVVEDGTGLTLEAEGDIQIVGPLTLEIGGMQLKGNVDLKMESKTTTE